MSWSSTATILLTTYVLPNAKVYCSSTKAFQKVAFNLANIADDETQATSKRCYRNSAESLTNVPKFSEEECKSDHHPSQDTRAHPAVLVRDDKSRR